MEFDSEDECEEASQHPPASPNCGEDTSDIRPYTSARVTSREATREGSRGTVASRDFELGTQTLEEEYLVAARQEMMECISESPVPRGQVISLPFSRSCAFIIRNFQGFRIKNFPPLITRNTSGTYTYFDGNMGRPGLYRTYWY